MRVCVCVLPTGSASPCSKASRVHPSVPADLPVRLLEPPGSPHCPVQRGSALCSSLHSRQGRGCLACSAQLPRSCTGRQPARQSDATNCTPAIKRNLGAAAPSLLSSEAKSWHNRPAKLCSCCGTGRSQPRRPAHTHPHCHVRMCPIVTDQSRSLLV